MAGWNNAPFLQALGWATLNSIWQMAFLWLCFIVFQQFYKLTSSKKYLLSVSGILLGAAWFIYTFCVFYFNESNHNLTLGISIVQSSTLLPVILSSASIAYLSLLIFPALRTINNWRFIQRLKKQGLQKTSYSNRVFVQRIGLHLGIKKNVPVYLSQLVTSPVTIGFLKPIILLPLSAISNLTTQQVEAILLHELAHIRRHDYLINLLLTIIHVVLYFNPFVKFFLKKIELERESCCDEMVLQFEYDKVSYASALLELEKNSQKQLHLAMAAVNKNHLLHRIENIVGMKKKQSFKTTQLAGALAGLLMLVVINALIFSGKEKLPASFSINSISQPSSFFLNEEALEDVKLDTDLIVAVADKPFNIAGKSFLKDLPYLSIEPAVAAPNSSYYKPPATEYLQVCFDEADAALNTEQKEQVSKTVANTKRVLEIQWKEVDKAIGDAMTAREKRVARQDYLKEINQIDWKGIERNLKAGYEEIDWNRVNSTVADVMASAKLDSLEACYSMALAELNKLKTTASSQLLPMPDVSVQQVQKTKTDLKSSIRQIQKVRSKKVVRL